MTLTKTFSGAEATALIDGNDEARIALAMLSGFSAYDATCEKLAQSDIRGAALATMFNEECHRNIPRFIDHVAKLDATPTYPQFLNTL